MKHSLIFAALVLSLSACSEKPSDQGAAQKTTPAAAGAPAYLKAETARPASVPATLATSDSCFMDAINDQLVKETTSIADKSKVKFEGWAANVAAGTTPEAVYIALEGPTQAYIKANIGLNRPDVAAAFNKPSVTNAGWIAFTDLSALAAGSYKIRVIQTAAAAGLVCEIKSVIVIN
jgi:hypothetical protein